MNYFYARISNENLSFDNQLSKIHEYSRSKKIRIDRIIKDVSVGFENKKNNCLYELLNTLETNDTLYSYNLSRISRHAKELSTFFSLVKSKNLKVVFLIKSEEEIIVKAAPIELSVILANISEIDAQYISIVTKRALNGLKEKGIKLGRPQKYDSEFKKKVVELHNAGKSLPAIAKELHAGYVSVWRMTTTPEDTTVEADDYVDDYADIPLETRLEIWGDKKIGKTNEELAVQYHLDIKTIENIINSLKGGAHW